MNTIRILLVIICILLPFMTKSLDRDVYESPNDIFIKFDTNYSFIIKSHIAKNIYKFVVLFSVDIDEDKRVIEYNTPLLSLNDFPSFAVGVAKVRPGSNDKFYDIEWNDKNSISIIMNTDTQDSLKKEYIEILKEQIGNINLWIKYRNEEIHEFANDLIKEKPHIPKYRYMCPLVRYYVVPDNVDTIALDRFLNTLR